jgi:enterochelin esterase family protein
MGQPAGAWCTAEEIRFALPDPGRRYAAVRLQQHVGLPGHRLAFARDDDGTWQLALARPAVQRLEYHYELRHHDGGTEYICDPHNPHRVGGDFGDSSVLACPGYTPPSWPDEPGAPGGWRDLTLAVPALKTDLGVRIWSPREPTDRILLAHDGRAYDRWAGLGRYSAAMIAAGRVPAHHLVLLDAPDRLEWYAASPAYAWALAADVLPRLWTELGGSRPVVGIGASLGALGMLHAQRRYPGCFAGLFLQSGSFFQPRHDRQESGFERWLRIVRFTGRVRRTAAAPGVPTLLTCGTVEENLANNRDMARWLWRQGYPAALYEVPDAHNWTGWRDALDPYLTDLLRRVWL